MIMIMKIAVGQWSLSSSLSLSQQPCVIHQIVASASEKERKGTAEDRSQKSILSSLECCGQVL